MNHYKLTVAYDGTRYFGWQKTKNHPTIQGEIERASRAIFQEEIVSEAASRTDRGVHARGQLVQITTSKEMAPERVLFALNAHLPPDIRVREVEKMGPSFHVTLDAIEKTYFYHVDLGAGRNPFVQHYAWHYPQRVDLETMRQAASAIVGERDFSAFTTLKNIVSGKRAVSRIEVVLLEPALLRIEITGPRFLYKMARTIAGTLIDIGAGKIGLQDLPRLFSKGVRALAGVTAPAHGLTLQHIASRDTILA